MTTRLDRARQIAEEARSVTDNALNIRDRLASSDSLAEKLRAADDLVTALVQLETLVNEYDRVWSPPAEVMS